MSLTDLNEQELRETWTLLPRDMDAVNLCRTDDLRRRFALQLCALRARGRFISDFSEIPPEVITYLNRQLDLTGPWHSAEKTRAASDTAHHERIRIHLGFRSFDDEAQALLTQWIEKRMAQSFRGDEILETVESFLLTQLIELPSANRLHRFATACITRIQDQTYKQIADFLSPAQAEGLEKMLDSDDDEPFSFLSTLKSSPPDASPARIQDFLGHYQRVENLGILKLNMSKFSPGLIHTLASTAQCYNAYFMRRTQPKTKRLAMLVCFVIEASRTLLDHILGMNEKWLTVTLRHAKRQAEEKEHDIREKSRKDLEEGADILSQLLQDSDPVIQAFVEKQGRERLNKAIASFHGVQKQNQQGELEELCSKYIPIRQYAPAFFDLDFGASPGAEDLLRGIEILRQLNKDGKATVPSNAPTSFIKASWRKHLRDEQGQIKRRPWEMSLLLAVRDALQTGDLYLEGSRNHRSFGNYLLDDAAWEACKAEPAPVLPVPDNFNEMLAKLRADFNHGVELSKAELLSPTFASIDSHGKLKLKREDALEVSAGVRNLRGIFESQMPIQPIEDVLWEVDKETQFSDALRPPGSFQGKDTQSYQALLAALTAEGTNVGLSMMERSTEGLGLDKLRRAADWNLRHETLSEASMRLINAHTQRPISRLWGDGTHSSSDGQRFKLQRSSNLACVYPRHFGYYDKAFKIYTHVSNQYSVIATQIIACSTREAMFVLDGLLDNHSLVQPVLHSTDTDGYTDQLFGLCYILGFSFCPRIKDLPSRKLFKLDRDQDYGSLEPLFSGVIDLKLLREQWDELTKLAASLKMGISSARVLMLKLVGQSPASRLAKALTTLGQAVKTAYVLRYLGDPQLRRIIQSQLNRGEERHQLSKHLCFANRGEFKVRDLDSLLNQASCLSLLSNVVLYSNTRQMERILQDLESKGHLIDLNDMSHVSPIAFHNVIPHGTYRFRDRQEAA